MTKRYRGLFTQWDRPFERAQAVFHMWFAFQSRRAFHLSFVLVSSTITTTKLYLPTIFELKVSFVADMIPYFLENKEFLLG